MDIGVVLVHTKNAFIVDMYSKTRPKSTLPFPDPVQIGERDH